MFWGETTKDKTEKKKAKAKRTTKNHKTDVKRFNVVNRHRNTGSTKVNTAS